MNRLRKSGMFVLAITCAAASLLSAAQSVPSKQPFKPEDIIFAQDAQEFRISPDGRWLVWVMSEGDKEKDARISNLMLSSLTEDRQIQLTRGSESSSSPRWSPDGEWVAFLSSKSRPQAKPDTASLQIWLINPHGGEPYPLTDQARAPRQIEWLDKDTIVFSAEEDPSAFELAEKKRKDDSDVVDDAEHKPPVRLFKINVKDGKITRLTENTDWIEDWAISKDGKYVVAVHARSLHFTFDQKVPPITVLHNLADGSSKTILTEGRLEPASLAWATDSSGFYFSAPFSNDPKFLTATIELLYYCEAPSGRVHPVPLDSENGLAREVHSTPDGVMVLLSAGYHFRVAQYSRSQTNAFQWTRSVLTGEQAENIQSVSVSNDGKLAVYSYSTASRMSQLYRAQLNGSTLSSPVQITKLNESLIKSRDFSKTEVVRWKGANDEEVEGILYYPQNYDPAKKYPLITAIHGGPTGYDMDAWSDRWAYPMNLLTQRGAFVLRPNYHGSGNYGLKWVESICCGKYYDLETPDINKGVDYLIARGLVNPDKIATMGWSNGAILSTSLIVNYPSRYKAASVGAGDVEWISDWGNVVFGDSFDSYYFGKAPFQDPDLYIHKSPFFKLDKVQAPVLIFHGTADNNVPTSQSWSYFRALQFHAKVPVKLVLFPGEPHGPRKLSHQLRKINEELAWFDTYLFATLQPPNEALKAGSPLDLALRSKSIARSGSDFGVLSKANGKSVLVPETVKRGNLEIGRFEVTRAQWAYFDKNYKFEPGTDNFPANNITFATSQGLCGVAVESQPGNTGASLPSRSCSPCRAITTERTRSIIGQATRLTRTIRTGYARNWQICRAQRHF